MPLLDSASERADKLCLMVSEANRSVGGADYVPDRRAERKFLQKHAISSILGEGGRGGGGAIDLMQLALEIAAAHMGRDKADVAEVKAALRDLNRGDVASRLGKVSQHRNAAAHLDFGILRAMEEAFSQSRGDSSDDCSVSSAGKRHATVVTSTPHRLDVVEQRLTCVEAYLCSVPICFVPLAGTGSSEDAVQQESFYIHSDFGEEANDSSLCSGIASQEIDENTIIENSFVEEADDISLCSGEASREFAVNTFVEDSFVEKAKAFCICTDAAVHEIDEVVVEASGVGALDWLLELVSSGSAEEAEDALEVAATVTACNGLLNVASSPCACGAEQIDILSTDSDCTDPHSLPFTQNMDLFEKARARTLHTLLHTAPQQETDREVQLEAVGQNFDTLLLQTAPQQETDRVFMLEAVSQIGLEVGAAAGGEQMIF